MKILIAGKGGQGVQTLAQILARAAFKAGCQVSLIPNYGLEQRGGMSLAYLQISQEKIAYPRFSKPDILVIMSAQVKPRVETYWQTSGQIFETEKYLDILKEQKLPAQSYNVLVLGMLAKILAEKNLIAPDFVKQEIISKLEKKAGLEDNLKAFEYGLFKVKDQ